MLTITAIRCSSSMISSLAVPFGLQSDFTTVLVKLSEKERRIPYVLDASNFFTESFLSVALVSGACHLC